MGLTQLVGWGTLYYSFSIFVTPIHEKLGWSYSAINAAVTVSLITWAICAPFVGNMLHTKGARFVMSTGSLIASFGLLIWGLTPYSYAVFLTAWMLIGISMSMVLYESSFAVLTTQFENYKKGINLLTIVGGLASTIFIPIVQFSIDKSSYEETIWLLFLLNLAVNFPLHFIFLPKSKANFKKLDSSQKLHSKRVRNLLKDQSFLGLLIWFSAYALLTSGFSFLLFPLLLDFGVDKNNVIYTMALIGVMQVVGRVVFIIFETKENNRDIGIVINIFFLLSILILLFSKNFFALLLFAFLYGSAKGIMSIIKGTAAADLFSLDYYTRINGFLSGISGFVKATSPLLLSILWTNYQSGTSVLFILLIVPLIGIVGVKLISN